MPLSASEKTGRGQERERTLDLLGDGGEISLEVLVR